MTCAFVIPGDLSTRTGGYNYERRLLETLPEIGRPVRYLRAPAGFPTPDPATNRDTVALLRALPEGMPLIVDGLIFGSMETDVLASLKLPLVAMLHHPLGLEEGLPPALAQSLLMRERANLAHAAHVVVPSAHTRDVLTSQFGIAPERISIALPGFDRPHDPTPLPRKGAPLILSVGILCARKGHDVLLDALGRLTDLDWQAAIVGMTHETRVEVDLRAQCTALGLDGRVHFTGALPDADVDHLFRQAHVFALATRYEGYGMVFSEAQLYGLPIVTCNVGAVPQTVAGGGAVLVPPDDPLGFAQALRGLLIDRNAHHALRSASHAAGRSLPQWCDTAKIMDQALDLAQARFNETARAARH